MPPPVLGFVVTGAGDEQGYEHGYGHDAKSYVQSDQAERAPSNA